MSHPNSPLTFEGKRRLCERVDAGRPLAHVAIEAGISRATLAKWYGRWREEGEAGLVEKSSRPHRSPNAIGDDIVDAILELRRTEKWGNARIAAHLADAGIEVSASTVQRTLKRHDLSRVRDMDPPTGEPLRVIRYEHAACGDMVQHSALDWLPPVARTPAKGRFVIPEPVDETVEITEAQMSIFDLLG